MKKFTTILLALCVSVAFSMTFVGCDQGTTSSKTETKKTETKTPPPAEKKP